MVQVLWRRSNNVDKQQMDALFDVAMSCSDDETSSASSANKTSRSSRKRPREQDDKTEGQGTSPMAEFKITVGHRSIWTIIGHF